MRTMAIAPILPLIYAAFTSKNLTLTATDHILHDVSTDRADEFLNLLTMLIDHVIRSQSLSRARYFLFGDTLDHCSYVLHKFYCAFFCLLGFLCHWRDPNPRQWVLISYYMLHWGIAIGNWLGLQSSRSGVVWSHAALTIIAIAILCLE